MQAGGATRCAVELDEASGEANGAAYLVHMLLSQQAEGDASGRFARSAARLKPVRLFLTDTGEGCVVQPAGHRELRVTGPDASEAATAISARSGHVIDVTQLRLAGNFLIVGPVSKAWFWALLRDIALRRVVIRGLFLHYFNTMRFLSLVNVR